MNAKFPATRRGVAMSARREDQLAEPTSRPGFLELRSVGKRVSSSFAIEDVSLGVGQGEVLVIVGPSGSGKSTLLGLLAGFASPDTGSIFLDDVDLAGMPVRHRRVGMMFQNYALFPHMTVRANVLFGLRALKVPKREAEQRYESAIALVQMTGYDDRYPHQLSGGQQQRVALARTLVTEPKAMLFDEPLSGLDPQVRESVRGELGTRIRETGLTAVVVSHDQADAAYLGDKVAVMRNGRLIEIGTYADLYWSPKTAFVAGFVGDSNWLQGTVLDVAPPFVTVSVAGQDRPWRVPVSGPVSAGSSVRVMVRRSAAMRDVRPDGATATIQAAAGDGCARLRGTLARSISVGASNTLSLEVGGGSISLDLTRRDCDELRLCPGQAVDLALNPELCRVFPQEEGEP